MIRIVDDRDLHTAERATPAIETRDLSFGFLRTTNVLQDVTISVPRGATCGLLGPNGAGKSTLLELLAGLHHAFRGEVRIDGASCSGAPSARPRSVTLVSGRVALPTGFTVGALRRYIAPWYAHWDHAVADTLQHEFALADRQRVDTLSFGNRMKLQLLCAIPAQPAVLLLDEPFTGLDIATKDSLVTGLLGADDVGTRTTVIASHDLAELELLIDHLIVIDGGRITLAAEMDMLRRPDRPATLRELYSAHTTSHVPVKEPAA